MFLIIILSPIVAVFCQKNKNIEIELQYEIDGSFENLKYRNVRPIPQDIPEDNQEPILVTDLQSVILDEHDRMNADERSAFRRLNVNENPSIGLPLEGQSILFDSKKERINDSASNLLQVLEEISEFREELVAEAQKRIRAASEQATDIEQSELGLRPREVEPLNNFRRMNTDEENLNRVNFRKTKEIRGLKKYYTNMSSNSAVSIFPLKNRKPNLEKRTTSSPRDRDRKAASDVYKFLKAVSLATPRQKEKSGLKLQITRNIPKITQEEKINSEILALSKQIDLLASKRKVKSEQTSLRSKKGTDFTSPPPDEKKAKTLIDIAKALDLITSQDAKDALSQFSALGLESKFKSPEHIKTPKKSSELILSPEYYENSNLTERKNQLELELQRIRKEIDLLTPKRDKKLSTKDIFSITTRPKKIVSASSFDRKPATVTTTERRKTLSIPTEHETQLTFQNIMNHRGIDITYLKPEKRSEYGLYGTHEASMSKHSTNNYQDSYNLGTDVTLSESKKQTSEVIETQTDFEVRERQPDSVLENLNKLLNLTLLLKETEQDLPNVKIVPPTTIINSDLFRWPKKRLNRLRPSFRDTRRINILPEKLKLRDQRKHSTRNLQKIKESEIDKFRKQLRMEYDSLE